MIRAGNSREEPAVVFWLPTNRNRIVTATAIQTALMRKDTAGWELRLGIQRRKARLGSIMPKPGQALAWERETALWA